MTGDDLLDTLEDLRSQVQTYEVYLIVHDAYEDLLDLLADRLDAPV